MSFIYNEFKRMLADREVDWSNDDVRFVLVMSNTTFDTEDDIDTMGGATTPDYCDGVNHDATNGHALANEVVTEDAANSRVELSGDDHTIGSLGVGTRQVVGIIVLHWDTDMATSVPIAYIDTGGFPFDGDGTDLVININAEGLLQIV